MSRTTVYWSVGYLAVMALLIGGAFEARRRLLVSLNTPEARAEWDAWREETVRQSRGEGPVARRPAKAAEPPMLILLRDHFPAAVGTLLLPTSLLYWFLSFLLRGSVSRSAASPSPEARDAP